MFDYSALKIKTAPTSEPLNLNKEVKPHLRLEVTDTKEDEYLRFLIKAARKWAENASRRVMILQTWDMWLDEFPPSYSLLTDRHNRVSNVLGSSSSPIMVPLPPYSSTTHLKYTDEQGALQTLVENTDYTVDSNSEPARIFPAFDKVWPATRDIANVVELEFEAGFTDADSVPCEIKMAMLFVIAHWYENREEVSMKVLTRIPLAAKSLIDSQRVVWF